MRALITGSTGFIGSSLADRLLGDGHEVIGVDRRHRADARHIQITADLNDPAFAGVLSSAAEWADVVFHLASLPGVRTSGPDVEARRQADIVGATERLLAVTPTDTHVLAASSSSVYGSATRTADGWRGSAEPDPLRPAGSYAAHKVAMEDVCEAWDGRMAIVRPFTVVGERQRPDMAVSLWLDAVVAGRPVEVFGSLRRARDLTDVAQVTAGLARLAEVGFEGVVNLGTGRPRTLEAVIEAVFSTVGREVPLAERPASSEEVEATCADTRRAADLGIHLHTDLGAVVARQHAASGSRRRRSA